MDHREPAKWQLTALTWVRRHQIRACLRDSIWILPAFGMVLALIIVPILSRIDQSMGWRSGFEPATALVVLGTLATSMFTFIVFVASALLLAVQLASAQLTPRIISFLFRNPVIKLSLALFVFTFTFTLAVLVRINTSVPPLMARLAAYACLASLATFLYLIDHVGKLLRANGALRAIGLLGRDVIESVYPRLADRPSSSPDLQDVLAGGPTRTVNSRRDGAIVAFDAAGLIELARRFDCVIEVVPQVGDFIAMGDPLFRIFQGGAALPDSALHGSIAIGRERTFEQDPAFAVRIIVDIASKALSPAINDPTTAVLALDEIQHLLRAVGNRRLDDRVSTDSSGTARLAFRTPDWGDFVNLGVTEIRQYGGESIQIARRLRSLLENLIRSLPEQRAAPLRLELAMLRRSTDRFFANPEDRALAEVCDPQGVGGRHPVDGAEPAIGPRLSEPPAEAVSK